MKILGDNYLDKQRFAGIDLHSNNSYIAIIDNENRRVFKKKVSNDLQNVLHVLEPHRKQSQVESSWWYNAKR